MAGHSFPYTNMVELVHYWSCHEPHRPAFIFVDKSRTRFELTRRQLYELGGRWAAVLQQEGVGRKDRVVSTLPNSPERALCDVGIVMAGATVVNAQCQLADGSDMLLVLRQSKASAVCVNPDFESGPWHVLKQHVQLDPVTKTVTSHTLPDLQKVFFIRRIAPLCQEAALGDEDDQENTEQGSNSSEEKKEMRLKNGFTCPEAPDFVTSLQASVRFYKAEVTAEETVIIFTTSGSTSFSKLVPTTHASLLKTFQFLWNGRLDNFVLTFNYAPLGWLGGYMFTYLALGRGRLLLDIWHGLPDNMAAFVWNTIVQEGCLDGVIMPFLLPKILALEDREPWKMKSMLFGGQPINKELVRQALELADRVLITYASSELLMVTALIVTDASEYQDFLVGKILPNNTVKICDNDGQEVPRGTKGEIYAKTQFMTEGYFNNAEDTAASFTPDGFLKIGDIGMMMEDGSLVVEGRHPDIIHRGVYVFYPTWLENRIMCCCPGLQDVLVVAVPDPAMGQEICACFVPSDPSVTEEHVRNLVESDILPKTEDPMSPRPRYYLSFEAFPRGYTEKPLRKDVRLQAAQRLNMA